MATMNNRERMFAFIRGLEHDRVPFAQYDFMTPNEMVWQLIGRSNIGLMKWVLPYRFVNSSCSFSQEDFTHEGLRGIRTFLHTPVGMLTEEKLLEPVFNSAATHKHFVCERKDYEALLVYLKDITVVEDAAAFDSVVKELGDDGLPHATVMRTPYQQMWVQWVSIERLCCDMIDYADIVEECMSLMGAIQLRASMISATLPLPYVVIGDNITAPMIGEQIFRKWCLPYYNKIADIFGAHDIPVVVHMDGDLKPLWSAISETKIAGFDSFSPPPDNDTSVADAIRLWPDKKIMLNFPSSVHLESGEEIYSHAVEIIRQAAGTRRLQIQISENIPPDVWRKSYPQIVRAIHECGVYN
ncbi:MAG TPA: uroporphyrinogen decarboxylase family protein [Methylococcales bacterium]